MKVDHFENVKDQVGVCGIWCGSCVVGNGVLRELTQRYEELVKSYGLKEWGPKDFDFGQFMKGFSSIQGMPLCQGCLKGDGKPNCEFRACASSKGIEDCTECDQPGGCSHSEALQKMREGALRAGLMVQTEKGDRQNLIDKWTAELKGKWPHAILFMSDDE